jgi:hypothetical protein
MSEETIFALALEQADPAARAAFLDTACNGDAALRQRVEAMLRAHEQVGDFLERPALDQLADRTDLPDATGNFTPDRTQGTLPAQTSVAGTDREYPEIPGYEILGILGHGGMGVVYKARQLGANRLVALKMLRALEHASPTERLRFQIETEAVACLQHPHIVQLHEVGEVRGQPFFSLEFCDGGTLAQQLKKQRPTPRESAQLIETLARAMHYAHLRGVVHRDLKPANVLLAGSERVPKITDFGLARQLDSDSGQTQAGVVMGTPSYMAPEQASGRTHEAGPAADVYALGAILYHCLAGQPPFQGQATDATLELVRTQEPVPPSRWQKGVPVDLETICLKCLRKEPEKRYASAAELADDLQRYQRGEPILARRVGSTERAIKWVKRNPWLAGAAASVVLSLAVGVTYGFLKYRETEAANANLEQANGNLEQANDNLLTVGARALLRPLAAQVQPRQPLPPLNDQEIEPLWELAGATDEALRLRFVAVALDDPTLRRRLTARAPFALQAAVGLDAPLRKRVEELLVQRLQAGESAQGGRGGIPHTSAEEQEQMALCLAHLGGLDGRLAGRTADVLVQAMTRTTETNALQTLAVGLAAVGARLEPKDAAAAAATLTQAMTRTTDHPYGLQYLAQGLAAVAARLESKEAAQAATTLAQTMTSTKNPRTLHQLAQGLVAVAARLEPKEAAQVCGPAAASLTQEMTRTTTWQLLPSLAQGLAAVAARLEPKEAAQVCGQAAAILTQALSKPTIWQALQSLSQALEAVASRLEPKEAAAAAATLTQAMTRTTDVYGLQYLAQGLAAVAARLEPKEAAQVCGQAASTLTQNITKNPYPLGPLTQGLAAVAARLEPKEAAEIAAALTQALSRIRTDSIALQPLAQGLAAVAARLEPKEAAQVCGPAAVSLTQALTTTMNPLTMESLTQSLAVVAARLEAKEAAEIAATLTQAMSKNTKPYALGFLAQGLAAVAARLEPKEAAQVYGPAAATLTQEMTNTTNATALQYLAQGLAAVVAHLEPKEAAQVCGPAAASLTQAMSRNTNPKALPSLAQGLAVVAGRLEPKEATQVCGPAAATLSQAMTRTTNPYDLQDLAQALAAVLACELPPQALVDLLKHPCCVGDSRRLLLEALARHYQRPFATQWDFVDFAQDQKLGLDLSTPLARSHMLP